MRGLRLEVDLDKIGHNTRELVDRAALRNISVTAVTKAMLGVHGFARVVSSAGACALGDSRIENIERMRSTGIDTPMLLLRSPAPSQIARVVESGAMSVNTEAAVLSQLASVARSAGRIHAVMVMVELGDLREGGMPDQVFETVRHVLKLRSLHLAGVAANFACRSGVEPTAEDMAVLSSMVESIEETFGFGISIVSGGNSANLDWAFGSDSGRVNNLRLGESILLGREPRQRRPIPGLYTDAFLLVAEVIESQRRSAKRWGRSGQDSLGETGEAEDRGEMWQTILAVGQQDTDTTDLTAPSGVEILAASSDHLILRTDRQMRPGQEVRFQPGYAALVRSMTSPFVSSPACRAL